MAPTPSLSPAGVAACRVCGCRELEIDEVEHDGPLRLVACPRCDHRYTERPAALPMRALPRESRVGRGSRDVPAAA